MKLKELRRSKNISQEQAANALGISLRAYQNYEYEQREPNIEMINKLADFYGVTTDCLLGRKPLPNPFADFDVNEDDTKRVMDKFMSLPPEMQACALDVLRKLSGVFKGGESEKENLDPFKEAPAPKTNDIAADIAETTAKGDEFAARYLNTRKK